MPRQQEFRVVYPLNPQSASQSSSTVFVFFYPEFLNLPKHNIDNSMQEAHTCLLSLDLRTQLNVVPDGINCFLITGHPNMFRWHLILYNR